MADRNMTTQEMQAKGLQLEAQKGADALAAVAALLQYAAFLSQHGGKEYLPDLRDVVETMACTWAPEDFIHAFDEPTKMEQETRKAFNTAVRRQAAAPPTGEQAETIIRGLSLHAEAMAEEGWPLQVWQCCRVARRLREDFTGHTNQPLVLQGNFEIDESERFMKFGCMDREHVMEGRLCGYPVLVFRDPVPAEQTPEGWHCYHLSGRNIEASDRLWSVVPQHDYAGSVLMAENLIQTKRNMMRIDGRFTMRTDLISLGNFCEQHGFRTEVLDRLFPEQEMERSQGGITLA